MPTGRPRKFESQEVLEAKIQEYFEDDKVKPTITGLALHLGFSSRQSIYDYINEEDFSYTMKKAVLRIENAYELKLHEPSPTGAIFALKNFGWKDKTETDVTTNGESINKIPYEWNNKD